MECIGTVESLWRYPVKSMRGEEIHEAFVGFPGIFGDRVYAFESSGAPKGFPYLTARELESMLLFQPRFLDAAGMARPANLAEAEAMAPGVTPRYPEAEELALEVETPQGERLDILDPRLLESLRAGVRDSDLLKLQRSHRAMTDCRPVSLFSIQTARQLGEELGIHVDKRRFRANIYLDLKSGDGFDEDAMVGRTVRIGDKTTIAVLDRDPRCKMITLDPDTGEPNPDVIKQLARNHETKAGVYGAVLVEGTIRKGDEILVLN
ncbi:MAG: MOSC domain-containing protein [Bryobacterales bacterium]|nr:MOSC domain-containing protein [Bryobacterales bacterium]